MSVIPRFIPHAHKWSLLHLPHLRYEPGAAMVEQRFRPRPQFGGPRGRVGKVAEFQHSKSFDHLTAVTGVGLSPALATCETSHVLLAGLSGGFPGVLSFCPTFRLASLDMSEIIILKGTLN